MWQYRYSDELYHKNGFKYIDKIRTSRGWRYIYDTGKNIQNKLFGPSRNEINSARDTYKRSRNRYAYYSNRRERLSNQFNSLRSKTTSTVKNIANTAKRQVIKEQWAKVAPKALNTLDRMHDADNKLSALKKEKANSVVGKVSSAISAGKRKASSIIEKLRSKTVEAYKNASKNYEVGKKKAKDIIGLTARQKVTGAYIKKMVADREATRAEYTAKDSNAKNAAVKRWYNAVENQKQAMTSYWKTPLGRVETFFGRGGVPERVSKRENEISNAEYRRLREEEEKKRRAKTK